MKITNPKELFFQILKYQLICYLILYIVVRSTIPLFNGNLDLYQIYTALKLALPLLLFIILKTFKININFKKYYYPVIFASIVILLFLWMGGFPFTSIFGNNFRWHYAPAIEYLIFSGLYFFLLSKKYSNDLYVLTLTSFLLIMCGLLYELPFNQRNGLFFRLDYPFILYSAWIMLPLLLKGLNFKTSKKTIVGLALTMVGLLIIYYLPFPRIIFNYGLRLPFLFFWCIPLYEFSNFRI